VGGVQGRRHGGRGALPQPAHALPVLRWARAWPCLAAGPRRLRLPACRARCVARLRCRWRVADCCLGACLLRRRHHHRLARGGGVQTSAGPGASGGHGVQRSRRLALMAVLARASNWCGGARVAGATPAARVWHARSTLPAPGPTGRVCVRWRRLARPARGVGGGCARQPGGAVKRPAPALHVRAPQLPARPAQPANCEAHLLWKPTLCCIRWLAAIETFRFQGAMQTASMQGRRAFTAQHSRPARIGRKTVVVRAAKTADGPRIAIVGVTGAVGQEFLTVRLRGGAIVLARARGGGSAGQQTDAPACTLILVGGGGAHVLARRCSRSATSPTAPLRCSPAPGGCELPQCTPSQPAHRLGRHARCQAATAAACAQHITVPRRRRRRPSDPAAQPPTRLQVGWPVPGVRGCEVHHRGAEGEQVATSAAPVCG